MSDTAFITSFSNNIIAGYEQKSSLLRRTVFQEAVFNGNVATFLIADSGGGTAVTRGNDGDIPGSAGSETQPSVTLQEWHRVQEKTGFNIFAHQAREQIAAQMVKDVVTVMNRKIDQLIITALDSTTVVVDSGAGTPMGITQVQKALTKLGNAQVPLDEGKIFGVVTPAAMEYIKQQPTFSSSLYVNMKPYTSGDTYWKDANNTWYWAGVNWLVHSNLPNAGLSTEKCFIYHMDAVGFAADTSGMKTDMQYESRHDRSWARATLYMGALKLQNAGIVEITHDGSSLA